MNYHLASTEEPNTTKALELLWPLLQTKLIIRLLAKFLTSSDIIHDVFSQGFFTDDQVIRFKYITNKFEQN